jgi:hypothetical protein
LAAAADDVKKGSVYLRNHSSTSGLDDESNDPELSQNPGEGNPVPEGEELERKDGLGCSQNNYKKTVVVQNKSNL